MKLFACVFVFLVVEAAAIPISEPVYANQQYVGGAGLAQFILQPQYAEVQPRAHPVFEQNEPSPQAQYVQRPAQPLAQPLLGNVDRQVQKAAHHLAGPLYAQQIQNLQLQGQAAQAQAQIERNALRLATAPRAQPLQYQSQANQPVPQHDIPQEYNDYYR